METIGIHLTAGASRPSRLMIVPRRRTKQPESATKNSMLRCEFYGGDGSAWMHQRIGEDFGNGALSLGQATD